MNHAVRMTWLRVFLRVLSGGYLAAFIPWITLILLNAPILAPGGSLAPLLRFQPYNALYESMLAAIHIAWAVMLWRASDDPARHLLFIDFTIWANVAHGLVMLIATPAQKGLAMTFIEGLPLFAIAAVLWWLRPRRSGSRRPAAGASGTAPSAPAFVGRHARYTSPLTVRRCTDETSPYRPEATHGHVATARRAAALPRAAACDFAEFDSE